MAQIIRFYKHASDDDLALNIIAPEAKRLSEVIYSFDHKPLKKVSINFSLSLERDSLNNIMPEDEKNKEDSVDSYLSYVSVSSRQRGFIKFELDTSSSTKEKKIMSCKMDIDPSSFFGFIEFGGLLVRNNAAANKANFLTSKHSILGTTKKIKLYIDPFQKFEGSDMDVSFGKLSRSTALYELIDSTPPRVLINEDAPQSIIDMFKNRDEGNQRALVRDALWRPIVVDIWEQLARKSLEKMMTDEDSAEIDVYDPEDLEFPYNRIAEVIAKSAYGGSREGAIGKLKSDMRNQKSRLKLINETLPMVVQELNDLTGIYKKLSKKYWNA